MKKRIMIMSAAIAASGIVAAVGTAGVTNAASATTHHATKADRTVREHAKLTQAVSDGVITEAQKQAFLTEAKTLRTEHKSVISKTSTKAEREDERTKLKTELKAWATTNNFPLAKIFPKLAE